MNFPPCHMPWTRWHPTCPGNTLSFHYGKHHNGYVVKLNTLVPGTKYEGMSLMDVIAESSKVAADKGIFNNSAQIWNHSFFWAGMSAAASAPSGRLAELIDSSFGSMADFKAKFLDVSANHFGSGYSWLTFEGGKAGPVQPGQCRNPRFSSGGKPLLNLRCLGTRLLPGLPEPASEVPGNLLRHAGRLGCGLHPVWLRSKRTVRSKFTKSKPRADGIDL